MLESDRARFRSEVWKIESPENFVEVGNVVPSP
jgi:hypothetical protein